MGASVGWDRRVLSARRPAPSIAGERRRLWRGVGAAAVAGVGVIAAAPPVGLYPVAFVAFVPLLVAAARRGPAAAAVLGWVAGMVAYGGCFRWVVPAVARMQDLGESAALAVFAAFAAYHALQWAAATAAAAWCLAAARQMPGSLRWGPAAVASCWVLAEWTFPQVIPWPQGSALGPARWLRQAADLGGAYGLSFAIVLVNALLAQAVLRWRHAPREAVRALVAAAAAIALLAGYGAVRLSTAAPSAGPALRLAIVQGGVAGGGPDPDRANTRAWEVYGRLTEALPARGLDLVIWPETTLRAYLRGSPALERLAALAGRTTGGLLLGALDAAGDGIHEWNSAYLIEANGSGAPPIYHKAALVPFAERVPAGGWLPDWRTTGRFIAGSGAQPWSLDASAAGPAVSVAPSICYEAIFPGWFNGLVRAGANVLVNLTDDSWLAGTVGPAQHLELSRLRAVETRRWLVRSSGSGVSAVIDPSGEIVASLPYGEVGTLARIVERRDELTPYALLGDWIVWGSAAVVLALVARGWWRGNGGREHSAGPQRRGEDPTWSESRRASHREAKVCLLRSRC